MSLSRRVTSSAMPPPPATRMLALSESSAARTAAPRPRRPGLLGGHAGDPAAARRAGGQRRRSAERPGSAAALSRRFLRDRQQRPAWRGGSKQGTWRATGSRPCRRTTSACTLCDTDCLLAHHHCRCNYGASRKREPHKAAGVGLAASAVHAAPAGVTGTHRPWSASRLGRQCALKLCLAGECGLPSMAGSMAVGMVRSAAGRPRLGGAVLLCQQRR